MKNEISLLRDLLFIYDRLYWDSDIGRQLAQQRIDEIHDGKYNDNKSGFYVQCSEAINRIENQIHVA